MSKDYNDGIAWLKGIDFSNGVIEFDVRGEDVEQHSFVGIAFHAVNNETYDAIYFRPFRFNDTDEVLKNRSVQYISLPKYTWQELRGKFPGKYEHAIVPSSPDPNAWFKVRVEVKDKTISTYVNGSETPSLVVEKLTDVKSGSVGFFVADTSEEILLTLPSRKQTETRPDIKLNF
ncbi:MAG: hypothetical protein QM734_09935 [Cyclobacteriaceae bacterium]